MIPKSCNVCCDSLDGEPKKSNPPVLDDANPATPEEDCDARKTELVRFPNAISGRRADDSRAGSERRGNESFAALEDGVSRSSHVD
jgi:hypothetical protein